MMLLLSLIPKELMQAGSRINTSAHVTLKRECVINPPLFPPNLATCEQKKKIKNHDYCVLLPVCIFDTLPHSSVEK